MSAYICGPDHFKALAIFAALKDNQGQCRVDPRYVEGLKHEEAALRGLNNFTLDELATLYANTLYQENIRSVRARYPSDTWDELPGPCVKPLHLLVTSADRSNRALRLKPIAILKMLDCLNYQSCETDDWRDTVAFRLLECIRSAAIRTLPGYEDAPWDYYSDEHKAAA